MRCTVSRGPGDDGRWGREGRQQETECPSREQGPLQSILPTWHLLSSTCRHVAAAITDTFSPAPSYSNGHNHYIFPVTKSSQSNYPNAMVHLYLMVPTLLCTQF